MTVRVECDRHYFCVAGKCVAPAPKKLAAGRAAGACVPRRVWWLRTKNSAGRRVSLAFKTEQEARLSAQKVEAARVLGQDYSPRSAVAPSAPRFREVAETAIKLYIGLNNLSHGTVVNHTSYLKQHLVPEFGSKPVTAEHFSRLAIKTFIAKQREIMADSTLKTSLPTLSLVLDHAVDRGLLSSNPMRGSERLWKPKASEEVHPVRPGADPGRPGQRRGRGCRFRGARAGDGADRDPARRGARSQEVRHPRGPRRDLRLRHLEPQPARADEDPEEPDGVVALPGGRVRLAAE